MNADLLHGHISRSSGCFLCGAVQESGGITAKRAESAKRWRRGGEGKMGGGGAWERGGTAPVYVVKFL